MKESLLAVTLVLYSAFFVHISNVSKLLRQWPVSLSLKANKFIFYSLQQNSYRFVHEYANVTDYNPKYIRIHKAYFHKYNRTDGAFNILFTTNKEIKNIVVSRQIHGFLSQYFNLYLQGYVESWAFKNNEFKRTAVDFKVPVCEIYKDLQKYNIGHLFENSNLSLSCPIKAVRILVKSATKLGVSAFLLLFLGNVLYI